MSSHRVSAATHLTSLLGRALGPVAAVLVAAGSGAGVLCAQSVPSAQAGAGAAAPAPARAVSGEVVQAETGAALEGATVVLAPATPGLVGDPAGGAFVAATRSAVTGPGGAYRFDGVPSGRYVLRVSRLGFRAATVEVELRGGDVASVVEPGTRVSVGLTVVPVRLRPVEVGAVAPEPFARHARTPRAVGDARTAALRLRQRRYLSTDVREVTQADVAEGMTLGETDLFRALQRLPGVSTRNDFTAELWTRGARWDQTRVTFDGLPLYNPLHVGGLLSAVNADAVGAAFLHPGVRPAALGEGGAAVLDLRSRPGGGGGALRGVTELSLLSARATLDQRVAGGRGAWMLSARRSYLDLVAPRLPLGGLRFPYYFAEVAGRADWQLGPGRALEVSVLRSQDYLTGDFTADDPNRGTRARWGNTVARVTLAAPARLGPLGAVTARHTVGVSAYEGVVRPGVSDSVVAAALRRDLPMQPVRAGLAYLSLAGEATPTGEGAPAWTGGYELSVQRAATTGALRRAYTSDALDSSRVRATADVPQLAVWAERRARPVPRLTTSAGLRAEAGPPVPGGGPIGALRLAPRLAARYALGETFVSAGLGRSYQYVQTVPGTPVGGNDPAITSSTLRPVPLWLAAGTTLDGVHAPALRTDLATLGAERWVGAGWQLAANAYARRSAGLAVDDPRPGVALGRPLFVVGSERARGVEFGLRKLTGRWTMSANYAAAHARTAALGLTYPSIQDQRRVFGATSMLRLGRNVRLGGAYTGSSGAPFTVGSAGSIVRDSATGALAWRDLPQGGPPGADRLPSYGRYDLLFDWSGQIRSVRAGAFVQVHNLTQRTNAVGIAKGACVPGPRSPTVDGCFGGRQFEQGMPMIPVVGLRLTF